jgi:hypothetical protein
MVYHLLFILSVLEANRRVRFYHSDLLYAEAKIKKEQIMKQLDKNG